MKNYLPFLLFALQLISMTVRGQNERFHSADSILNTIAQKLGRNSSDNFRNTIQKLKKEEERVIELGLREFEKLEKGRIKYEMSAKLNTAKSNDQMTSIASTSTASTSGGSASSSASNSFGQLIAYPSPTAASITVNANESVDTYTGRINLSIPLFNLKSRHLEVPITVNYSSAGAKVDEYASWIGHQVSLSAGGAITRVMKNLPDEFLGKVGPNCRQCVDFNAFGYLSTKAKINLSTLESSTNYSLKRKTIEFSNFQTLDGLNHGSGFPEAWDTQPDEFYFNFGSYSGKFVFDQDGNIITVPYQNFKINKTSLNNSTTGNIPKIVKFEITTDDGTVYVFGDENMTAVEETKLETLTMSNFYQYWTTMTQPDANGLFYYFRLPKLNITISQGNLVNDVYTLPDNSHLNTYKYFTSCWYLKEIRTPNQDDKITFNYSNGGELTYIQNRSISVSMPTLSEAIFQDGGWRFLSPTMPIPIPNQLEMIFPMKQAFNYSVHEVTVKSKRLNSIVTDIGNSAIFSATTARSDLPGDKRLDAVTIMENGFLVKNFKFDYEEIISPFTYDLFAIGSGLAMDADFAFIGRKYSILTDNGQSINPESFIQKYIDIFVAESKRLFLKTITEVGFGGSELPPYIFHYDPTVLPRKFSYQKDRWGYYNSNSRGTTMPVVIYTGSTFDDDVARSGIRLIGWDVIDSSDETTLLEAYRGANLSANSTRSQAGMLKKIVYPTGSSMEFSYSLNTKVNGSALWGMRVTETKTFKDKNDVSDFMSTKYSYSGGAEVYPTAVYGYTLPTLDNEDVRTYSSSQMNPTYMTKGSVVGYRLTNVFSPGIGKVTYTFKNPTIEVNEFSKVYQVFSNSQTLLLNEVYPFPQHLDTDWRRGLLEKVEMYNEGGVILSRTTNFFDTNPSNFSNSFSYALTAGTFSAAGFTIHRGGFYKYQSGWVHPVSTVTEVFDQLDLGNESKKITSMTSTYFNRPDQNTVERDLMPRKIEMSLPTGDKMVSESKYPLDYTITATPTDITAKGIHMLKSKKIESVPIETISYLERTDGGVTSKYLLGASLTKFKEFQAGKVYPWETYKLKAGIGNVFATYPWSTIDTNNNFSWPNSTNFKLTGSIGSYDAYGNPLTETGEDGIQKVYKWGYNNSLLDSLILNAGTYQHKTTYTHRPLVGITQVTDPNSRNSKYTYDNFNRLKLEKDHDDKITARYRYHYQNQVEGFSNLTINKSICAVAGLPVSLSSYENLESGQTIYTWNFGDGNTQATTATSVQHTYAQAGTYTVNLKKENPEYQPQELQISLVIYRPVSAATGFVTGPTTYDICTLSPPTASTTLTTSFNNGVHQPGDAFNVVWEYRFNGGSWNHMSLQVGPISSSFTTPPPGFGDPTITGTWEVRCTGEDKCGNQFTTTFTLTNYASNPICSQY